MKQTKIIVALFEVEYNTRQDIALIIEISLTERRYKGIGLTLQPSVAIIREAQSHFTLWPYPLFLRVILPLEPESHSGSPSVGSEGLKNPRGIKP